MIQSRFGRSGWDPFAEMQRLQNDVNRLFEGGTSGPATSGTAGVFPPVNLWLGERSVVVTAELPGLSSQDIDLTITDNTLTIRGECAMSGKDEKAAWHRRERPSGPFSRTVELPFRVDPDRVQGRFVNGVLEVEMQRPEAELPRKIEIKAG